MTAPRDEKGRFVSAKPVLHRQVVEHLGTRKGVDTSFTVEVISGKLPSGYDAEWLQAQPKPDPHGPRIEVAVVWAIVAAVAAGLAFVAHLLGAW